MKLAAALLTLALAAPCAGADRSAAAVREFRRAVPCPATGATRGACPGWQVDHIVALCAGGADAPENMQWLALAEHRGKTRADLRECRLRHRRGN